MNPNSQDHERTGINFDLKKYFEAAVLCRKVIQEIANQVTLGINEKAGQQLTKEAFKKIGILKFWHPTKFRIGKDTTKNFGEVGDPDIKLVSGDMFFIDAGPIIEDHEADYGETFVFKPGLTPDNSLENLSKASISVWKDVAKKWQSDRLTGRALYKYAEKSAESLGYKLNPRMGGHRLGDFPHALFSKKQLADFEDTPTGNLWVLEIHLLDEKSQRGAFFEDILVG